MQEERLEPWKNAPDDSRIRLLNRLYAKKKKELKEVKAVKVNFLSISIKLPSLYMYVLTLSIFEKLHCSIF